MKNKKSDKKTNIKLGKFEITKGALIEIIVFCILVIIYILSPRCYSVTTGLYNQSTAENQKNVENAMGMENTEERFKIYFQWYNVIHELGHGLLYYNNGVDIDVADEEQLVNDFAVAYWKYYGEEDKVKELEDIVNYAVLHVGTNYENGIDKEYYIAAFEPSIVQLIKFFDGHFYHNRFIYHIIIILNI